MSKRNRAKRAKHQSIAFPFRLLQHWVKPFASGLACKCGEETHYCVQSFFDLEKYKRLIESGKTDSEATDVVWDQALSEQLKGVYKVSHVHHLCQECAFYLLSVAVGDTAANVAMLPMMILGDLSSVIVGSELSSIDDEGKNFAGMARAQTIDELLAQMRGQVAPIHLRSS